MDLITFGIIAISIIIFLQFIGYVMFYYVIKYIKNDNRNNPLLKQKNRTFISKKSFVYIQLFFIGLLILIIILNNAYIFIYIGGLISCLSILFSFYSGYRHALI